MPSIQKPTGCHCHNIPEDKLSGVSNLLGTHEENKKAAAQIKAYLPHTVIQIDPYWVATIFGVRPLVYPPPSSSNVL
jgi:hypothetical protein